MLTSASFAQQYQVLQEAVRAFGFTQEAALIDRRADTLEQPFALYVMGCPGAGKSTVIDVLAGAPVTPPGRSAPWLNLYRRAAGRPYAEVHHRGAALPEVMPVAQAQTLSRTVLPFHADAVQDVERIVWHVDAPDLPDGIALVEAPCSDTGEVAPSLLWEADAFLWVLRADQLNEEEPAQALIKVQQENKQAALPALGVITHMDSVAEAHWGTVLQYVRTQMATHLDHVVPFAMQHMSGGRLMEHTTAPLRRDVRIRFFHNADAAHARSHARFLDTLHARVATRFEAFVDRVLEDRGRYLQACARLEKRLSRRADELGNRIAGLIAGLEAHARTRATHLEAGTEPPPPPVSLPRPEAFFVDIRRDLLRDARQVLEAVAFDGKPLVQLAPARPATKPGAQGNGAVPVVSLKLPPPPLHLLALLRGDVAPAEGGWAAARLFHPAQNHLDDAPAAAQAALWQTASAWIAQMTQQAAATLARWAKDACDHARKQCTDRIDAAFHAVHGFRPEATQRILLRLETFYLRLRGKAVPVPTPHLAGQDLSPALFLLKMQEPGFIEQWNRALVHTTCRRVLPGLTHRVREELEQRRDALLGEWAQCRSALDERLQAIWQQHGHRPALANTASWSLSWGTALMRGILRDPGNYLARSRFAAAVPAAPTVSLFIGQQTGGFLRAGSGPGLPSPEQVAAAKLQEVLAESAQTLWKDDSTIQVRLPLRRQFHRRLGIAGLILAACSAVWIMLYGTGIISLSGLTFVAICYAGGAWFMIERFLRRGVERTRAFHADHIHQTIYTLLNERVDQIQRAVAQCVQNDAFFTSVEQALTPRQATAAAPFLPYGELTQRLFALRVA